MTRAREQDPDGIDPAGLHPAVHAAVTPDRVALVMSGSGETRTYRELDEASARLALVLRDRGMRPGDHMAVLLDNEPTFFDAVWAGLRSGLYVTPPPRPATSWPTAAPPPS